MSFMGHLAADIFRQAQNLGLSGSGQLAARWVGEPYPTSGDLRPWQVRTLESLQAVICEPDRADLPAPDSCGALEATLKFMRSMPTPTVERMAALLAVFEAAPIALGPKRKRLSELSLAERRAFLASWPDSKIPQQRAAFHAIKTVCMMGYWSRAQTWSAIGYSIQDNPGVPTRLKETL